MISNIKRIVKKHKLSVYIALFIVFIGIISISLFHFLAPRKVIKKIDNNNYLLKYDYGWKISKINSSEVLLTNNLKAKVNIKIITLKSNSKYLTIDDLMDEIIYNIGIQNSNYKLLSKKATLISKYNYTGVNLLYENKKNQVMITVYKKSNKLVMISYQANNKYFDILLASVENIIYNFNVKEKSYNLKSKISINTNKVSYSADETLDKNLKSSNSYVVANNNYYVKYKIPSNFELDNFDSTTNYFQLEGITNKNMSISVNIFKYNVFEMLDKNSSIGIYKNYATYKNNKNYSKFHESLTKMSGKFSGYLYKNSYYDYIKTYDKNLRLKKIKRKNENVNLIYILNKNHVLFIDIRSSNGNITKKLINSIKIENVYNYASYLTAVRKDNVLVSTLKRYADYDKKKIDEVNIKMPQQYKELQSNSNIYEERTFGLNYNDDTSLYDYKIHYNLTRLSGNIEENIKSFNSAMPLVYGEYNYLTYFKDIILNGKKFILYTGGYTQLGGIMFTNVDRFSYYVQNYVLFYEMADGGYLVIEISGNGKNITDEILNDATNLEIRQINS